MKIRNYRMIPQKNLACAKAGLRRECGLLGRPLKSMRLDCGQWKVWGKMEKGPGHPGPRVHLPNSFLIVSGKH